MGGSGKHDPGDDACDSYGPPTVAASLDCCASETTIDCSCPARWTGRSPESGSLVGRFVTLSQNKPARHWSHTGCVCTPRYHPGCDHSNQCVSRDCVACAWAHRYEWSADRLRSKILKESSGSCSICFTRFDNSHCARPVEA